MAERDLLQIIEDHRETWSELVRVLRAAPEKDRMDILAAVCSTVIHTDNFKKAI